MRRLDALYLEAPFYGSRRMVAALRRDGVRVGRHRVRRLMRLMGLETLAPKPGTSRPDPAHRVYPYLLRGVAIARANQVWCADVTLGSSPRAGSTSRCAGAFSTWWR